MLAHRGAQVSPDGAMGEQTAAHPRLAAQLMGDAWAEDRSWRLGFTLRTIQ